MKKYLNLTYLLLFVTTQLSFTQSISNYLLGTTGNFNYVSSYSLSYSVGELSVSTSFNSEHIITQGFQQVYPDSFPVPPITDETIQVIIASPNPVFKTLNVDFLITNSNDFSVEIYNIKGSKILITRYPDIYYRKRISLDFNNFPKGLYLMRVFSNDGKILKIFKIEKM